MLGRLPPAPRPSPTAAAQTGSRKKLRCCRSIPAFAQHRPSNTYLSRHCLCPTLLVTIAAHPSCESAPVHQQVGTHLNEYAASLQVSAQAPLPLCWGWLATALRQATVVPTRCVCPDVRKAIALMQLHWPWQAPIPGNTDHHAPAKADEDVDWGVRPQSTRLSQRQRCRVVCRRRTVLIPAMTARRQLSRRKACCCRL